MDIMIVFNQMLQLFIMIIIGFGLGKTSLFEGDFNQHLTKFVLNITMPAMIVASIIDGQNVTLAFSDIMISTIILVIILPIFAYLYIKILPFKQHQGLYMFMTMFPNVGFMGFPLMQAIFGSDSLLSTAIINMGFNLSLFTLGIIVMSYGNKVKTKLKFKNLLSPGVIASILAILLYFIKLQVPLVIANPLTLIGNMTTPLAMIIIGATLANYRLTEVLIDYKVYLFTIFIDLIIPILFYPLIITTIKDVMIQGITLIILAMPVASGAVLFAKNYHQDEFLAAKTVFISTLLAIITIPLLVYLFLI